MSLSSEKTKIVTKICVRCESKNEFIDWQSKLNAKIAAFPGFVSLEILSPIESIQSEWILIQRFNHSNHLFSWSKSKERQELMEELKRFLADPRSEPIEEIESDTPKEGVTEIFVTQVDSANKTAYYEWLAKIHQMEAKFPGFRGVYVQSPTQNQGQNWITLLQFDTLENLDHWLSSSERQQILVESKPLITSLENHRVISSYAGWFASIAKEGTVPPVWKQTMIVLLVLFPIVMLELKYLSLLTSHLNSSLATFIGNALSVTLIAWPFMPIAIWFLGWWLSPKRLKSQQITILGTLTLILLYLIEIGIFWNLL